MPRRVDMRPRASPPEARARAARAVASVLVVELALVVALVPVPVRAAPPVEQPPTTDAPSPSDSEPEPEPETAAEWYARGYTLGKQGDNEAAAAAFLRSYALQPTSEALYNAALAYENAEAYVEAIATYRRFLAEPEPSAKLVPVAERSIETLLPKVGTLKGVRYEAERPPAELRVDGQRVALDAFPLLVMPGEIEITVIDDAGTARDERYEILAGESLLLDLRALLPDPTPDTDNPELDPGPDTDVPPPELDPDAVARAQRDQARAVRLRKASFGLTGVAGGAAIATLTVGALAIDAWVKLQEDTCWEFEGGKCPADFVIGEPERHNRDYERYALGTAIAGSVTAGFAVAALVTGLISLRSARRAKLELEPRLGGLALRF